ncbi:TRAP transporter small permease [Pseudooceanicola sp. HF7]|uniref:TRAP transporter small permease n=1 Tax=Pseudooceanicola sp. HF7 TaxID=2721560 RepID=UPI001431003E|nr:TRAP transporter small permease subunit [Pseudooceanicola sp. HF7]NIZ07980.1 TRAP transporter small permease subunit [Pseudooceanicola sp. HF7]
MTSQSTFLRRLERAGVWLQRGAEILTSLGFIAVSGAFIWTVVCRYLLRDPSHTSEELAIVIYLWVITIGASLAVRLEEHVAFDLLASLLPPRATALLVGLGSLVAGGILLAALPFTIDYIAFLWREKTTVMRIPLNQLYACFAVLQGGLGVKLVIEAARQAVIFRSGRVAK